MRTRVTLAVRLVTRVTRVTRVDILKTLIMNKKSIVLKMDRSVPGRDVPYKINISFVCMEICFPFLTFLVPKVLNPILK